MARRLKRGKKRILRAKMASRQKKSKKLEARYQELQTLQEISEAVLTSLDIQIILERILDKVLQVGPFDVGAIRLLDASGKILQPAAHRGYRDLANLHSKTTDPKDEATGMILVQVMAAKGLYRIEDVPSSQGMRSFKKEGVRSAIVVPVRAGEEILGVIQLGSRTPRRFRPEEISLFESIGSQMGLAVQKARLFEKISAKSRQLEGLSAITKQITQIQESDRLLAMILEEASRLLRAEGVGIRMVVGDELRLLARTEAAEDVMIQPSIKVGESLSGRIALESRPIAVYDLTSDSRHIPEHNRPAIAAGFRSFLGVPLRLQDKVIGTLSILTKEHRHFSQEEMDLVSAFADQAAVAIQNTRLFEESNRRREQAEALREIGLSLTATHNPQQVLDLVAEEARRLVGALFTFVAVPDKPFYRFVAVAGDDQGYRHVLKLSDDPDSPYGQGPLGRAIRSRKSVVCEDVLSDPLFVTWREIASERGIRSLVAVPLVVQEEPYGAILVYSPIPRAYEAETLNLLGLLAAQAGAALENARLYEETERRRREAEELARVAKTLTETLDMTAVAERVVTSVRDILDVKTSTLRLLQSDGSLRALASRGEGSPRSPGGGQTVPSGTGLTSRAIAEGRPVWSADMLNDPKVRLTDQMRDSQLRSGNSSMIAVPLRAHEKIIGALALSDHKGRIYSDREVALVQTFADQVALALENARLFEETGHRAREQAALNAIATATSQSLRIDDMLRIALDKVLEVTGREQGYIRLKDPVTGNVTLAAHRGISQKYVETLLHERTPGGKSDQVFESGEPLVINDPAGSLQKEETRREGSRAMSWFPMKVRGRAVGIMNVSTTRPIPFQPREVELLKAVGNVIGVAVENARLFEQTQRDLERIQALRDIDQAVTSTLDLHAVLKVLMEKIDLLLPYSVVQVWLMNKETGVLERTACWNLDEAEWKGRSIRGTPLLVKAAVEGKAPVTVGNLQTDPRTLNRDFYIRHGLVSYLGVPLIVKGQVLGVIVFLTREERQFTKEEIEFLSTLAGQAAMAIHNSQLHEQTVHQAGELEKASKVKDEFLGFVSHELRAPLNAVIAYTVMMQDKLLGEINAEQGQALEKMLRYSKELLEMINSLLEVTRIQAGRVEVDIHKVDLGRFVDDLKASYDAPIGKPITLNWDFASDLPSLRTDSGKLRHILQNLITNAIKYTERGSVSISARLCPGDKNVQFKVTDTGVGIPQESVPVIFEMFRQVDGQSKSGGVGLGLHIVKKFTELLGGKIDVESEVGKGSTFTVTIPMANHQEAGKEEASERVSSA
ncbi:MAG TPA: hypothetical protein DCZ05_10430 [Deltaproteobacteria bacterium]|nr:hypothetical protein [Deltaproteobacteria bacterium]